MADGRGGASGGGGGSGRGRAPPTPVVITEPSATPSSVPTRARGGGGGGGRAPPTPVVITQPSATPSSLTTRARGGGGGGGRGRGASPSRRPALGNAELADYTHMPIFAGFDNTEAYPGEFEDQEFLSILLSEEEHPPLIQELFGQVTGEAAAPTQPAPAGDSAEDLVTAPIASEVYSEMTENEATLPNIMAPLQDASTELGDVNLHAIRGSDHEDGFVMMPFNMDSAEDLVTAPIASEVHSEMTENEATLPNIMAPVQDASTELDDVNLHALRGSDREDGFVMVPFNMILVERDQDNQGNAGDLDSYLHERQWENALRLLDHMVTEGEADNGAVEVGAPERDIYKAHPELVLWLSGQTYVDLLNNGCTIAANIYYHKSIANVYPDGVSTGSCFADSILGSLRKIKRTGSPLRGSRAFLNREETRQCVEDYLKVYFPGYRPQLRETDSRVWEFGRKDRESGTVRCFVCHKEYRGLNLTKLEQHLQGLGHGKQGKCPAVTIYITQRLEQILAAEDVAGSRRRGPRAAVPPPPLHLPPPPPPPPDAAADAAAP